MTSTDRTAAAGEKTVGQALYEALAFSGVFCQFWRDLDENDQQDFELAARYFLAHLPDPAPQRTDGEGA